ncbi:MAG TPA: family 43 glycosylhydrolase [Acidimicrobiia bacterium]|jgi:hypothetical protein
MKLARPRRALVVAAALALALIAVAGPSVASASSASVPSPPKTDADNANAASPYGWFEAGLAWRGQFADPDIVRYHGTYYAYSSDVDGRYLGVMTSTDLVHWVARPHYSTHAAPWAGGPNPRTDSSIPTEIRRVSEMSAGDMWNLNDALVAPAQWGVHDVVNAWLHRSYWAVGVVQIGNTWYSYAPVEYSTKLADGTTDPDGFGRYCLTVASAPSPLGPFRDITGSKPLYCDADPAGSIDPAPFVDPHTGQTWLTWRATGKRGGPGVVGYPSSLKSARLDAHGHITGPVYTLLTTNEGSWEGDVIENPSMIRWRGRWYLFYSANSFEADSSGHSPYATGYAICASPAGPCHRPSASPLMASSATQQGPGGASAFLDASGNLRLAYAYYWPGENRPNTAIPHPRRMAIASVVWHGDGSLSVPPLGAPVWSRFVSPFG